MLRTLATPCLLAVLLMTAPAPADVITVGFEEFPLAPGTARNDFPGTDPLGSFVSGPATFNNFYEQTVFQGTTFTTWGGWAVSNVRDVTTPGFFIDRNTGAFSLLNQFGAYNLAAPVGSGAGGSDNYLVAAFAGVTPVIDLPAGVSPVSMDLTNATYAALSMLNGDDFAKQFTTADRDFFRLTITGYSLPGATGSVVGTPIDFYLADYQSTSSGPAVLVDRWTTVDLSSLAGARSLGFALASSDVGMFGMNTPQTFAMDNLRLSAVPEPSGLALLALGLLGGGVAAGLRGRRRARAAAQS